jgi:hypothetical protein
MLSERTKSAAADELLVAATAIARIGHEEPLESLPGDLEALTEALRAVDSALARSGARVVPAAESHDQSICRRYQRAAAMWPTDSPPCHERFAAALAHLDHAAAATRLAARRCDEARRAVEALLRTSHAGPS